MQHPPPPPTTLPPPRPRRHAAHVDGLAEAIVGAGRRIEAFTLSASGACRCGADGGAEHNVQVRGRGRVGEGRAGRDRDWRVQGFYVRAREPPPAPSGASVPAAARSGWFGRGPSRMRRGASEAARVEE
jgi:hypothetical protein